MSGLVLVHDKVHSVELDVNLLQKWSLINHGKVHSVELDVNLLQ